jgi:4-hydroxy-tetrahydrodipicolinate synthase
VKSIAGRIPVIAGTGSNNTQEALYLTESAWQHGADAALLVAPYYNRPSQRGMYEHFKLLAESVDIPQILYNVPGRTACDLELDTVDKLAELDNVIAIKDATGDLQRGEQLIERCTDRLAVYSGEDAITFPLMMAGAKGTISVTANTAPALMAQMCDLALAGDGDQAKLIDDKLMMLHNNLFLEGNPVPVKWALARMGLIGSGIRLPLVELDGKYQLQVSEALTAAGISLAASS